MKRTLSIVLCAAAVSAFGGETSVTEVTFSLYPVTSSSKNTIVAISLKGMDGDPVAVSDLVKTANLSEGDKLYTFENGAYEEWTLEGGAWGKVAKNYTMDGEGNPAVAEGTDASTVTKAVGSGIWLVRNDTYVPGTEFTFYLYGKPVNDPKTTIVGSKINLVGNPLTRDVELTAAKFVSDPEGSAPADGDRIEIPGGDGVLGRLVYTYNEKVAAWITFGSDHMPTTGNPTIPANLGFWYVSKGSGFKIDWSSTAD